MRYLYIFILQAVGQSLHIISCIIIMHTYPKQSVPLRYYNIILFYMVAKPVFIF